MRTLAILAALSVATTANAQTGRSTVFGYGSDRWAGGPSRCLGRKVNSDDWGVATRFGACGQKFFITNERTGLRVIAPRIDAGPYGAMDAGTWAIKRRAADPGVWRGIADLTPRVAAALGHRSFDVVTLEPVP